MSTRNDKRTRRHNRIRAKVAGTAERPRLAVFRSNRQFYAQIIDDEKATTILSASSAKMEGKSPKEKAEAVAKEIAKQATEKGIKEVVFDRGGFLYAGNIALFANTARSAGLTF